VKSTCKLRLQEVIGSRNRLKYVKYLAVGGRGIPKWTPRCKRGRIVTLEAVISCRCGMEMRGCVVNLHGCMMCAVLALLC
jgi:hypothetical protein